MKGYDCIFIDLQLLNKVYKNASNYNNNFVNLPVIKNY